MPWTMESAQQHTKSASTPKRKRQWAHVANRMLESGKSEGAAIRAANSAVKKGKQQKQQKQERKRTRKGQTET